MKINASESKTNFAKIRLKGKKITSGKADQIVIASAVNNRARKIVAKILTKNATISKTKID